MTLLQQYGMYFAAMLALTAASAFCSCAEAAIFSLQADDRRALTAGGPRHDRDPLRAHRAPAASSRCAVAPRRRACDSEAKVII